MKLSIDFEYVIKRIIVIVLAFVIISQLKSCEVFAENYNITPSTCTLFYNAGGSSAGSTLGTKNYNNVPYRTCTNSTSRLYESVQFNYQQTGISNGSYVVQFLIHNYTNKVQSPSVFIYSGTSNSNYTINTCFVNGNSELLSEVPNTNNTSTIGNTSSNSFAVYCPNVTIRSGWYQVYINSSMSDTTSVAGIFAISQSFNFEKIVSNSDINTSINDSSSQAHSDSQAIQEQQENINNSLNDNSVSNDTNSQASDIFDLDIDTGHGLTAIITSPLSFLSHTQDTCTPKSFSLFDKSITLPCGTSLFWARDFSSYNSIFNSGLTGSGLNTVRDNFRLFWNILFGGAIVFHLLIKLWEQINLALDPMSDSFQTISSAIDTGRPVRDEDELAPRPVVKLHGLQAKNVDSFVASKEV